MHRQSRGVRGRHDLPGQGLGLSIVHAIVVQHGGCISVEEAPGGGARFAVLLPQAG